jgi:hypothetical protein
MVFENIGFTRNAPTVGEAKPGLKWLICAECDLGKLDYKAPKSYVVLMSLSIHC